MEVLLFGQNFGTAISSVLDKSSNAARRVKRSLNKKRARSRKTTKNCDSLAERPEISSLRRLIDNQKDEIERRGGLTLADFENFSFVQDEKTAKASYAGKEVIIEFAYPKSNPRYTTNTVSSEKDLFCMLQDHKNIQRYYGSGSIQLGGCFIVKEKMEVDNLGSLIFTAGLPSREYGQRYSLSTRLGWLYETAFAMKHLHYSAENLQCIVHRRLTVESLGLAADGSIRLHGLSDAKAILPEAMATSQWVEHTHAPLRGSTSDHGGEAPEMAEGKDYNEKVDVYAFGLVMLQVLLQKPCTSPKTQATQATSKRPKPSLAEDFLGLFISSRNQGGSDTAGAAAGPGLAAWGQVGASPALPPLLPGEETARGRGAACEGKGAAEEAWAARCASLLRRCLRRDPALRPDFHTVAQEMAGVRTLFLRRRGALGGGLGPAAAAAAAPPAGDRLAAAAPRRRLSLSELAERMDARRQEAPAA